MALATRCPHCHTTFRVAADQLKLRGGIVRCGTCQQVFDGNATLVDTDAPVLKPAPVVPPAPVPEPAPPAPVFPAFVEPEPEFDVLPPTFSPLEYGNGPPAWYSARQGRPSLQPVPPPDAFPALFREDPVPAPVVEAEPAPVVVPAPEVPPVAEPEPVPEPAPLPEPVPAPLPEPEPEPVVEPVVEPAPAAPVRLEPTLDVDVPAPRRPSAQVASRRLRNAAAHAAAAPPPEAVVVPEPQPLPAPDSIIDSNGEQYAPLPEQNSLLRMESSPPRKSAGIEYAPDSVLPGQVRRKKGNRRAATVPAAVPAPVAAPRAVEADEPEFIKLGRAREQHGRLRTQLMAGGCVLLLLLLAVQGFASSRDVMAARYPALRPLALSLCAAFGCRVELPTQIDTLAVETGELQTLGNDAFTFTTLLRNQGTLVQAWPSLELTLHDANDKPLVRRVFAPRDYLPAQALAKGAVPLSASGFAAHTEQAVKLSFVLNGLKPSGYHIAIFYP
jgi:predicted Zn finger-like uncharacterized protein